MRTVKCFPLVLLLTLLFMVSDFFAADTVLPAPAAAASEQAVQPAQFAISKMISRHELEKYKALAVTVAADGRKKVKYEGVPLRVLLAELLPQGGIETMKDWKNIAKQELVMEVTGQDGYPGLVTALEVAINQSGDRFLLATRQNGKVIESGVQLICRLDEAHTRWVHEVVRLRLVWLPNACAESK